MKKFLNLKESFYNPTFYHHIKNVTFSYSLVFFIFFAIILGIFKTYFFLNNDFKSFENQIPIIRNEIIDNYPQDLIIEWDTNDLLISQNGKEADTFSLPYTSNIDDSFKKQANLPNNFLFYKNSEEFSSEELRLLTKENLLVLNRKELFFDLSSDNQEYQSTNLSDLLSNSDKFSINRDNIVEYSDIAIYRSEFIISVVKNILWLLLPIVFSFLSLLLTFFLSIFAHFLLKIHNSFSYKNTFQISLHLAIVVDLIMQITTLLYGKNFGLFGISFWILYIYLFFNNKFMTK